MLIPPPSVCIVGRDSRPKIFLGGCFGDLFVDAQDIYHSNTIGSMSTPSAARFNPCIHNDNPIFLVKVAIRLLNGFQLVDIRIQPG